MNNPQFDQNLKLKDLLSDFCGNPTPFKTIMKIDEDTSVVHALEIFEKSHAKRKVIEVQTKNGQLFHLGYNELLNLLKNRDTP